jgi:signal transduction histidine kinase
MHGHLLLSPPPPECQSGSAPGPADTGHEHTPAWRALAFALAALLAQSNQARVADAEHHSSELVRQQAAHARDVLRDRERFLRLVGHELKTPTAVIRAYTDLLDAQLAAASTLSATVREVVGHIRAQANVMSRLIESVLDVQRLRLGRVPLELGHVDLVQLANTVAEQVQHTTREHVIRVVAPDPPPPLPADGTRVRQVLVNLLENAVKYSASGAIEVRVGHWRRAGRPSVIVAVRDEGPGIDPANFDHIFDPFQQGSERPIRGHVGLGLGLYVARQVARAHQGDVWAESRGEGHGSTFYLALPLDLESAS